MNDLGDAKVRTWAMSLMVLLAAEREDQLLWLDRRGVETNDLLDEVRLLCRVSAALPPQGAFEPEVVSRLRAVERRLDDIDPARRTGAWDTALSEDPAWDEIRLLAREVLITQSGDWWRPLPGAAQPRTDAP
ncbi:hypothetical protein [Streptomyces sp. NPDC097619]|uniref:hypothetical protein n=1 Tax=Streptomyces sp. NPDC097619 TaxID=3157228 RepID=UPI003329CC2D